MFRFCEMRSGRAPPPRRWEFRHLIASYDSLTINPLTFWLQCFSLFHCLYYNDELTVRSLALTDLPLEPGHHCEAWCLGPFVPCLRQVHYLLPTPARSVTSLREDRKGCVPGMCIHPFSKSDLMSHVIAVLCLDIPAAIGHLPDRAEVIVRIEVITATNCLPIAKVLIEQTSSAVASFAHLLTAPDELFSGAA